MTCCVYCAEPGSNNSSIIDRDANDSMSDIINALNVKDEVGSYEYCEE